jgi:hypothetical protein
MSDLPPAAWLVVQDGATERRYRWPRAMALPRRDELIRLDVDDQAQMLAVTVIVHLLHVESGSHTPTIYAIPTEDDHR